MLRRVILYSTLQAEKQALESAGGQIPYELCVLDVPPISWPIG